MSDKPAEKTFSESDYNKAVEIERAHASKFKEELTELKTKFKDIDPTAFSTMKAELDALKNKGATTPEQIEARIREKEAEIRATVQKDIDSFSTENKTLKGQLKELQIVDRAFSHFAGKINEDVADDVKALIRRDGDLDDKGNIVFKDENGKIRYAPGSTTQPMTPAQYVEWVSTVKGSYFKSTAVPGTKGPGEKKDAPLPGEPSVEQYLKMGEIERSKLPPSVRLKLAPLALKSMN